jgi:hypothetical protein
MADGAASWINVVHWYLLGMYDTEAERLYLIEQDEKID